MVNSRSPPAGCSRPEIVVRLLTEVRLNDGESFRNNFRCAFGDLVAKVVTTTLSHTPADQFMPCSLSKIAIPHSSARRRTAPGKFRLSTNSNRPLARREEARWVPRHRSGGANTACHMTSHSLHGGDNVRIEFLNGKDDLWTKFGV